MHRCISRKNENAVHAFRTIRLLTVTRTHFLLTGVKKAVQLVPEYYARIFIFYIYNTILEVIVTFECFQVQRIKKGLSCNVLIKPSDFYEFFSD